MSYVWVYLLVVLLVLAYLVMLKKKETFYQSENNSENNSENEMNVVQTSSSSIDSVTTSSLLQEDDFNINFSIIDDSEKAARDVDSTKLNQCLGNHIGRKVKSFRDVSELMYNNVEDCNIYDATEVNIRENEGTRYFQQIPYW